MSSDARSVPFASVQRQPRIGQGISDTELLQRRTKGAEGNPRRTGFAAGDGDRAAIVVGGGAEIVEFQDDGLAARHGGIARRGKPADPVVGSAKSKPCNTSRRKLFVAKFGSNAMPEQAAFTGGIDREAHEWRAE